MQNITCQVSSVCIFLQFLWFAHPQSYSVHNDNRHFDKKTQLGVWKDDGGRGPDNMQGLTQWLPLHLIRWCKLNTFSWPKSNCALPTCFIIIITSKHGTIFWSSIWGHNAICSIMALLTSCSKCSHPNTETELWAFLISNLMDFFGGTGKRLIKQQ